MSVINKDSKSGRDYILAIVFFGSIVFCCIVIVVYQIIKKCISHFERIYKNTRICPTTIYEITHENRVDDFTPLNI